ncbi:MAG: NAD(P)H-hydrate epimerase [Gemmataceae bacterium]|nr:NAD(P)H-hydrate epimerase [Gemmataceae bacterium]
MLGGRSGSGNGLTESKPMFTLSRDEVRELDRRAIQEFGVPGVVLMENAGRGCAELMMRLNPDRKPTVILCGPGNNGGDGFVIARHLDNAGWPVTVCAVHVALNGGLPADADTNYRITQVSQLDTLLIHSAVHFGNAVIAEICLRECWIIDALFGTGLSRALAPPHDEIVAQVNTSRNPVLAIDIPSGLDCDTGEPLGPTVRATHTATFVAHKRGFLNPKSKEWTGAVHVVDIGAPRVLVDEYRRC